MLKKEEAENIVASLLKLAYEDVLDESNYNEISSTKSVGGGKARLFVALGRKDGMTAKKLVEKVMKVAKVQDKKIRNVEVYEAFSFITVPFKEAEIIIDSFKARQKGKKPLIEKAKSQK